jgi:hypothetical protein
MKMKAMLDVIIKKKLFGPVLAYCCRIEWQVICSMASSAELISCEFTRAARVKYECHIPSTGSRHAACSYLNHSGKQNIDAKTH